MFVCVSYCANITNPWTNMVYPYNEASLRFGEGFCWRVPPLREISSRKNYPAHFFKIKNMGFFVVDFINC